MNNTRLYALFLKLSKKDIRQLKKIVRSPYYNQRQDVILLLDYLIACNLPRRSPPSHEVAHQKLYPKQSYNIGKLRLVMTFLLRIIEQYLEQTFKYDQVQSAINLATTYRSLDLNKHFASQIKQAIDLHQQSTSLGIAYYENAFHIEWELYHDALKSRRGEQQLHKAEQNLDIVYFAKKLKQACYRVVHQSIYQATYPARLLNEILAEIEQNNLLDIPIISIYYHCYQALYQPPATKWFDSFLSILEEHKNSFPKEELSGLYLLALNFCINQYNTGNTAYLQEEFQLYKDSLEKGFLHQDGYLSRFTYRNIMTVCIAVNQLEWANDFIHTYKAHLNPKTQEMSFSFNLARLKYEQKDYKEALLLLQKSEFTELFTNMSAKIITAKIFYETKEWEVLDNYLQSITNFLYRKKDIGKHRENYLHFVRYLKKLLQLPTLSNADKKKLHQQITLENRLAERTWLLNHLAV